MTRPNTAEQPRTYEDALIAAAAVQAARTAGPNVVDVVALLSDRAAAVRDRAAAWAKAAILDLWAPVNPYSDRQVSAFAAKAADVMASAQTATARAASAALTQQFSALGVNVDVVPSNPVDVRAPSTRIKAGKVILRRQPVSVDYTDGPTVRVKPADMTTQAVFLRPAAAYRYAESDGKPDPAARATRRIDVLVDDNLMLAQRIAEQEVMSAAVDLDTKGVTVVGYRRVIHPELSQTGTCGLCIAAADRIYHVSELKPVHDRCWCTIAPVTEEHDPGDDVNQADLAALYRQAGGTSAAHLKRTRYKVAEHGELGAVLVPGRPYKRRGAKTAETRALPTTLEPESPADVARRHLPTLEMNLDALLRGGASPDSPPVVYHRTQIARFRKALS